ncbi:hypothetical protein ABW21_db0205788 [Orbilia brochopaga]|nr:hypothetical protein ABW21_db0205788 [Drechslerella brochopaga]
MPLPWETLLPFAIVVAMFGISGAGLATSAYVANGYKPKRWALDVWDNVRSFYCSQSPAQAIYHPLTYSIHATEQQMMRRDERLTNVWRGQTDAPRAPKGYELSSRWRLEKKIL